MFLTTSDTYGNDVEFDAARKWLFQGLQKQVILYADEGNGYQPKQII